MNDTADGDERTADLGPDDTATVATILAEVRDTAPTATREHAAEMIRSRLERTRIDLTAGAVDDHAAQVVEAQLPRLPVNLLKEPSADARALARGIDGEVLDQEVVGVRDGHEHAEQARASARHPHLPRLDSRGVLGRHGDGSRPMRSMYGAYAARTSSSILGTSSRVALTTLRGVSIRSSISAIRFTMGAREFQVARTASPGRRALVADWTN
nr:hypothetical protein [Leucobacter triazinivorans]